ncbi:type II secretion system protein GspM [Acidithiobacillus sp.]
MSTLQRWLARFDSLSLRERLLVLAAALVLVLMGGYQIILAPLQAGLHAKKQQWQEGQNKAAALEAEIQALLASAPQQAQSRLDAQRQVVAGLDQQLQAAGQRYPRQDELARWLRALLGERPGVRCTGFHTLPPQLVYPPQEEKDAPPGPRLYQSGVSLTLQGDFPSLLAYLQSVQQGPWRLQWGAWNYQVVNYPQAELQVDVTTYALDWSGRAAPSGALVPGPSAPGTLTPAQLGSALATLGAATASARSAP